MSFGTKRLKRALGSIVAPLQYFNKTTDQYEVQEGSNGAANVQLTKAYLWLKEYLGIRTDDEEALFVSERRAIIRSSIDQLRYAVKRVAKRPMSGSISILTGLGYLLPAYDRPRSTDGSSK